MCGVWREVRKGGYWGFLMNSFEKRGSSQVCEANPLSWLQLITQSMHKLLAAGAIYMKCVLSSTCLKIAFEFEKLKLHIYIFFSIGDQQLILYL